MVEKYLHVIVRASTGECSPGFACSLYTTCSFADDDRLAKVVKYVGDFDNVTLYVREMNKWTVEDLQLPNNNILIHFTFDNTQPNLSSSSNVVFPPHLMTLLNGLDKKRELPRGEVMLYVS